MKRNTWPIVVKLFLVIVVLLSQGCGSSGSGGNPDTNSPVAGGGGILTFDNVTDTSLSIYWTVATDNASAQADLEYLVYYSTSNNIGTVAHARRRRHPVFQQCQRFLGHGELDGGHGQCIGPDRP